MSTLARSRSVTTSACPTSIFAPHWTATTGAYGVVDFKQASPCRFEAGYFANQSIGVKIDIETPLFRQSAIDEFAAIAIALEADSLG
jgi:hypothetical protein